MNIINKEKILEEAKLFTDEGKYDKAIREYEKILLADPNDLRIKIRIAELYTKRKQIAESIKIYREVAENYAAEGFFLKAVTVYKNILRLNPSLIETNEQLAVLYEKMGLNSDAVRQYDILAQALEMKGQVEKALDIHTRIVALTPQDGKARIRLAELYQRLGKMDEAINQYEEYAKQLELSGAEKTKLADAFEKILSHRPNNQEMFKKLIQICSEIKGGKRALKWLEGNYAVVENDPNLLGYMAQIYASQNQNETARTKYLNLVELYTSLGDTQNALETYYNILVIIPDEEERLVKKIDELVPGASKEIIERAAKRRKEIEEEEVRRQEEEDKAKEGKNEEPKNPVEAPKKVEGSKSVKYDMSEADTAYNLGNVYKQAGLITEALAEFKKAQEIYLACQKSGTTNNEIISRLAIIKEILNAD